jgi:electron transfer flavoprotein beta subunit
MKILVCISTAPDTTSKITVSENSRFNLEGLTFIVGPYDDYALSRAIELKESLEAEVIIFHVGNVDSEPMIRKCLALGADRAVRIDTDPVDSEQVSLEICAYVQENSVDLILMGKETIDYGNAIVPGLVAAGLLMPVFSPVSHLSIHGGEIEIEIETMAGKAMIQSKLPAVLGCQEPIAEWKIPNMRGIMSARTKEILVKNPAPYLSDSLEKIELVETARKGIVLAPEKAEDLIDLLFNA